MKTDLGKIVETNKKLTVDVTRLLDTRMLIQASSGGGKSWLMRLMAERIAGEIPTFIIDPEGEFSTLREKLDIVIVGRNGELDANPRSAQLLARRLVELRVSAVLDLIELKLDQRRLFVKLFLESLMDLPQSLWRSLFVMIDEAHMFCPERSAGEAESTEAVIDLCSRGRKRGYAAVLATQRLSKLHKDAAAELANVAIGRTTLDNDQKRAIDVLGLPTTHKQVLRDLPALNFYAFGPSINEPGVSLFCCDQVQTTHPRPGQRHKLKPPQPSKAIKQVVSELADLPKQAEQETKDLATAQKQISELKRQLNAKPQAAPSQQAIDKAVEAAKQQWDREAGKQRAVAGKIMEGMAKRLEAISRLVDPKAYYDDILGFLKQQDRQEAKQAVKPAPAANHKPRAAPPAPSGEPGDVKLDRCARAILRVLAQHTDGCEIGKLALLSGYCVSGGFRNALTALRNAGYMTGANTGTMQITNSGQTTENFEPLPTGHDLYLYWLNHPAMQKCAREVLAALHDCDDPEAGLTIDELASASGYTVSGGFRNALTDLRKAGVMVGKNTERMKLNEDLF